MKKYLFALMVSLLFAVGSAWAGDAGLLHAKGQHAVGARVGKGTKNRFDVGLEWEMCFGQRIALLSQIDMESARFQPYEFRSYLLGSGVELMCWHPATWFFLNINLLGNFGFDCQYCDAIGYKENSWVGGLSGGLSLDFYPLRMIDIVLGAQQYVIWGWDKPYAKPNFSVGIRYVWNR